MQSNHSHIAELIKKIDPKNETLFLNTNGVATDEAIKLFGELKGDFTRLVNNIKCFSKVYHCGLIHPFVNDELHACLKKNRGTVIFRFSNNMEGVITFEFFDDGEFTGDRTPVKELIGSRAPVKNSEEFFIFAAQLKFKKYIAYPGHDIKYIPNTIQETVVISTETLTTVMNKRTSFF